MEEDDYTAISIRISTKTLLEKLKIIPDETWDSLLKRIAKNCQVEA